MTPSRIMVVEDERIVALHIRQQLEKLGYEVPAVVASGEQALQSIDRDRPDLILMDIRIDGSIDGIETASRVPPEHKIPVVYLTAYSEEATLTRAKTTAPYGYLLKPFSERELHATIQMALERNKAEKARETQEEQLHQSQKLEAIGQLAGGVAHDFNNLLAVIQGNLELMQERAPSPEMSEMIRDALKAAGRGTSLTQQLLSYSRRQPLMPQILEIPNLVTELTSLLRRLLGETIEIQTRLPDGMWKIRADQNQLESALINLAVNARDAMPDGGTLSIEGTNTEIDGPRPELTGDVTQGRYTSIAVSDTGTGMPDDVAERALEPFYTTKPQGKGTGLGLSQVFGFVRQSGGAMHITSALGIGTRVDLLFPAVDGPVSALKPRLSLLDLPMAQAGECILLVEDDEMVRSLVSRILTSLGYQAIEAEEGHEACQIIESTRRIDLMITDLVLPKGMNGAVLARNARERRPDVKVLFMSGYAADTIQQAEDMSDTFELIQKPFTKVALANKIRAILHGN
ncbi:response regulator [Emcibacter sp. SYSU 3D8]|uniref:hybrid sensor histidine kinase/response regulator n=1 Tax=Emcibacter sp. SYSU 3D8 TaxID=3133969 RepID=UPI0031FEF758